MIVSQPKRARMHAHASRKKTISRWAYNRYILYLQQNWPFHFTLFGRRHENIHDNGVPPSKSHHPSPIIQVVQLHFHPWAKAQQVGTYTDHHVREKKTKRRGDDSEKQGEWGRRSFNSNKKKWFKNRQLSYLLLSFSLFTWSLSYSLTLFVLDRHHGCLYWWFDETNWRGN